MQRRKRRPACSPAASAAGERLSEIERCAAMIFCSCPHCNRRLRADDSLAGVRAECPHCGVAFVYPPPQPPQVRQARRPHEDDDGEPGVFGLFSFFCWAWLALAVLGLGVWFIGRSAVANRAGEGSALILAEALVWLVGILLVFCGCLVFLEMARCLHEIASDRFNRL